MGPETARETTPWYAPAPITTRIEPQERAAFTPQELVSAVRQIMQESQGKTPGQIRQEIEATRIQELPYHAAHAYAYFDLPAHHYDPFDRQLIAQAIAENIPIVTPDAAFGQYPVKVIW